MSATTETQTSKATKSSAISEYTAQCIAKGAKGEIQEAADPSGIGTLQCT